MTERNRHAMNTACYSSINLPSSRKSLWGSMRFPRTVAHRGGGAFLQGATVNTKPTPILTPRQQALFWSHVDRKCENECWPWTASQDGKGYGRFRHGKKLHLAQRTAWFLGTGIDPFGFGVLHECDNPPCCNHAHLFLGQHKDNQADMTRKSRNRAILTPELVRRMRAEAGQLTIKALASNYGVHENTAGAVVRRQSWRQVE